MSFEAATSPTLPSFDLHVGVSADDATALLPDAAATKLAKLFQRATDAHNAMPSGSELHALFEAKTRQENRIKQLTAHKSDGGFGLPELAPQVVAERRNWSAPRKNWQHRAEDRLYRRSV
jgi:hypothetical protein